MQNEELRESQIKLEDLSSRYCDLYNFSPVGIFTLDDDGLILDVNIAGATLLGVERKRLYNRAFIRCIDPKHRRRFHLHCQKVIKSGLKQIVELRLIRDHEPLYVHLETLGILNIQEEIHQFRITAIDITENKKITKELEYASKYNRSLIEASLDPLVTIGSDGRITDVNHSTETVTGYTRNELIGTDFSNYFTNPKQATKRL
jgi:two-component system, chemotaxis family, sensor kinase Cph1